MSRGSDETGGSARDGAACDRPAKHPYTPPRLVVYGTVAKLTQSGGISVKDLGSMRRADA